MRPGWIWALLAATCAFSITACVLFWVAIWNRDGGLLLRALAAWFGAAISYLVMMILATSERRQ
jgi:hypothetical protein